MLDSGVAATRCPMCCSQAEFSLYLIRLAGTLAPPTHQGGASVLASQTTLPVWKFQSRGWHHRLRDGESYSEKWRYVRENPLRKKLCQRIGDWPFQGKVFDLVWTGK